jgi:hypothetical protein
VRLPWRGGEAQPPAEPPVPDDTPTDPLIVFRALERHGVDYVAIGGIAVQAHGSPRTTRDVDVLVGPDEDNLERLGAALVELRARLLGVDAHLLGIDPTDPRVLREGANFTLMTVAGELDVWTDAPELKGAAPWLEMSARAVEARVDGVRIRVCGRDDLIRMKRAADRPKDRQDIAALTDPDPARADPAVAVQEPPPVLTPQPAEPGMPRTEGIQSSVPEAPPRDLRPVDEVVDLGQQRTRRLGQERGSEHGPRAGPRA